MVYLVSLSLALNILVLALLFVAYRRVQQLTSQIADQLDQYQLSDVDVPFHVDEKIPVEFEVPYEDRFEVPIKTTIPVSTSILFEETVHVPIRDTVKIDKDLQIGVNIPVINQTVPILLPIRASIPVNLDVSEPLSYDIPVETEIPVDITVDIPIKTSFPVNEEIPVQIDFPVTIPVEETGLPQIIDALRDGLRQV
ncbi:MAG: hypothetical protein AAF633_00880 [Chloroflexota bacterium]